MKREKVSFRHAVELLRADHGGGDFAIEGAAPPARSSARKLPELATPAEDAALLVQVADYYHATLKETPEALAYLEQRGLVHADLIDTFRLGHANRTLGYRLPSATVKAGAEVRGRLQALVVLRESGHEHLRGSLVVPLFDASGAVANFYGRKIRDDLRTGTPDHLYLPGPQRGLFNPRAIHASEEIILCEALIDAMTFWCAGYKNVTSAFGVSGVTGELVEALHGHGVKRVLIAFDRDAAGEKGAAALADRLAAIGIGAYRVAFPYGQDANAYGLKAEQANRSLGALLRAAEWMAGGERRRAPVPDPEEELPTVLPEPSYAGPMPAASPPPIEAEIGARDVTVRLDDRIWRARGLGRNGSAEALKVNLMVRRSLGDKGEGLHVDSLDLLSAKHRAAFVAEAAAELSLPPEAIKRDIGQVLLKLEALQDEALMLAEGAKAAEVMTVEEEQQALAWLRAPDLLVRIAADVEACGVVGEGANAEAVYLAALSRKLDRPLAAVIQSTSAAGKSALMDAVLSLVPEEDKVVFSAMTGQSLFYLGDGDLKHKVLSIAEEEGARHASYALKLLPSQGALTIASTGKDPASGKLVTQTYNVEGPVSLMMTTTAIDLDEELRNRCLVLTIDESREQTQAIHTRQPFEETLAGLAATENRADVIRLHHCAQRLLKPLKVVNPYAEHLTFQDDQTRTRRDHRKYLTLIRTIALLHQHQRPIRKLVRRGQEPVPTSS
jgi:DNA primase